MLTTELRHLHLAEHQDSSVAAFPLIDPDQLLGTYFCRSYTKSTQLERSKAAEDGPDHLITFCEVHVRSA